MKTVYPYHYFRGRYSYRYRASFFCNDNFLRQASEASDDLFRESEDSDVMSSRPGEIDIRDIYLCSALSSDFPTKVQPVETSEATGPNFWDQWSD